jgi:hypothetical protein
MFFEILKGNKILIDESNIQQMADTIYFLKFDSDSVHDVAQNLGFDFSSENISSLSSLSNEAIETILSFPFIHFQNENQLFNFINQLIKKNRNNLTFIQYISFELITFFRFYIFIQFNPIS